jgi:SAM-dependent methyltransferase
MEAEVRAYYERGGEAVRLAGGQGLLERLRTQDILRRVLPEPPARVLDVGGATGGYAGWLAGLGYEVDLVDPLPRHVAAAAALPGVTARVGDARELDVPDGWADAILPLGPLYHLIYRADRVAALAEARRAVRPGGVVVAAAISRYASLHDGFARARLADPRFVELILSDLADGVHRNPDEDAGYFTTAYFHRPQELAAEVRDAGLGEPRMFGVEGVAGWVSDVPPIPGRWSSCGSSSRNRTCSARAPTSWPPPGEIIPSFLGRLTGSAYRH